MSSRRWDLPPRRLLTALDLAVAAWVTLCLFLAVAIAAEIRDVRSLTTTLGTTGRGLERAGGALAELPPIVASDGVTQLAADARAAGAQAQVSAREGRDSIETISVLTGIAIASIPTLAVLILYVPARIALRRRWRDVMAGASPATGRPGA